MIDLKNSPALEQSYLNNLTWMSSAMKRFSVAASAILLTSGLAFFAIAVAHRDSRNQMNDGFESRPEYADQAVAPIEIQFAPKNVLRPSLHEIGSIRSPSTPVQEAAQVAVNDSFDSFTEPPRIVDGDQIIDKPFPSDGQIVEEELALKDLEQDDRMAVQSDVQGDASEVLRAGNFEGGIQPLPPARLLPPPSVSAPPMVSSQAAPANSFMSNAPPALMPPGSLPSAPTAASENRMVSPPGFSVPSSGPSKLGPPTSTVLGASQFNSAPNISNEAPSLSAGNSPFSSSPALSPSATSSSGAPSAFAKPTNSWPNSTIQAAQALSPERVQNPPSQTSPQPTRPQLPFNRPQAMAFKPEPTNTSEVFLASSAPGIRQLDGSQNPSLQIHKRAPEEVQVGHPASFTLLVRNVGTATAYDVVITDSVPRGTRLSKTNPPAQSRSDGALIWSLGEMSAGSEQVLTVEVIPETEGEIGSVASVTFAAQASVRTVSTQPKLIVNQSTSGKVLLGQPIKIQISIVNEGTGVARGVSLEEDVPPGLRHPMGATLGVPLGDLVPGQSRTTQLELIGVEPGVVQNLLRAVSSNASTAESSIPIEVVAPQLRLTAGGPKLRYLERPATYQVSITNSGTSMAHNVEIFAYLPRGMQFNSAINDGEYLSDQHAVTWGLEELAVGATATTEMTLLPVEEGDYVIRMQGRGDGVKSEPFEKPLRIDGQSELAFSIEDDNDPIETDEQTTYIVKLINNGTRIDQDVSLMVELPPGAKVLQVNAPVAYTVTREGLVFEPIPQVKAKDQQSYRFTLQLTQEGTHVVRAQVKSKLRPLAIVKEESTQVYRDN